MLPDPRGDSVKPQKTAEQLQAAPCTKSNLHVCRQSMLYEGWGDSEAAAVVKPTLGRAGMAAPLLHFAATQLCCP